MAGECHQLEAVEDSVTGERLYEAMFANRPAWHNLGRVYKPGETGAMNSEEAFVGGHLDWLTAKQPMYLEDQTLVKDYYALVRQDTKRTLSVVGNDYVPLQNHEAFSFLDSLVQDGVMKYESVFALKGGKIICLLARMPSVDFVTREDASLRYIFLMNHHGGGAILGTPTSVRTVCANTVRIAVGSAKNTTLKLQHSGSLENKLESMRNYLSQFDKGFTRYREQAQSLLKGVTAEQASLFINELFPAPKVDAGDKAKTFYYKKMSEISKFRFDPSNNLPSIKGTWWSLFNSVTQYIDHGVPARQSKDVRARSENHFISTVTGVDASLKDSAFALALELAA